MKYSLLITLLFSLMPLHSYANAFPTAEDQQLEQARNVLLQGSDEDIVQTLNALASRSNSASPLIADIIAVLPREHPQFGRVAIAVVWALEHIGEPIIPYIDNHYKTYDSKTSIYVTQALLHLGAQGFPVAQKIITQHYNDASFMSGVTFSLERAGEPAAPLVFELLKTYPSKTVRENAALAITLLAGKNVDVTPIIDFGLDNFETQIAENRNFTSALVAALNQRTPTPEQMQKLARIAHNPTVNPLTIVRLATALADAQKSLSPETAALVIPYLENSDKHTQLTAALLMLKYGTELDKVHTVIVQQMILPRTADASPSLADQMIALQGGNADAATPTENITCSLNITTQIRNYAPHAQIFIDDLIRIYHSGGACSMNSLTSLRSLAEYSPKTIDVFKHALAHPADKYMSWNAAMGLAKHQLFSDQVNILLNECINDPQKAMAVDCQKALAAKT